MSPNPPAKQYVIPAFEPRQTCYRCLRPQSTCYCEHIDRVENRTHIIIVQHPRERFHPLGTVRIAERSLAAVSIIHHYLEDTSQRIEGALRSSNAAILFPSADAEDLGTMSPAERPEEIIVLDGTWHQAKTLLRDVPILRRFRRVRFTPPAPSEYRIRREPQADYLSTIESIAHVLRLQEPETENIEALNTAFRHMIDKNVHARVPSQEGTRMRTRVRKIPHRFPEQLLRPLNSLVSVYCEGTSRFATLRKEASSRDPSLIRKEPLVVYLKREGQAPRRFLIRTDAVPPTRLLEHLKLSPDDFEREGRPPGEVARALEEALRPHDVPVVWNGSGRQILEELGVKRSALSLKGPYCDWLLYRRRRSRAGELPAGLLAGGWGSLDDALERHSIAWPRPTAPGRGPWRLAQTEAVLGWFHEQAREHCRDFSC